MAESPSKSVVFLPPDDFGVERVFPIRNLVGDQDAVGGNWTEPKSGDDAAASRHNTPLSPPGGTEVTGEHPQIHGVASSASPYLPPPYPPVPDDDFLRPLNLPAPHENLSPSADDDEESVRRITERVQLVPTSTGPLLVAPGVMVSDGQEKFFRCEDEPIHTPGAIQQFGALLALRFDESGNLQVRIASENTANLLKYSPEQLFGLGSFLDILDEEVREETEARINNSLKNINKPLEDTHLDIYQMAIRSPSGEQIPLWCAIHIAQGTTDLLVFEFEALLDIFYLDGLHGNRLLPKTPLHRMDNPVTPEERSKSTTSGSLPLRVLQIARKKRQHSVSSLDVFNAMIQAQQQLAGADSTQKVLDTVVGLISELTGFHRVMFYRFDANKNGCVDAELVDPRASDDFFRGLHFPASDIPKQARDLYKVNRIRLLYDRDEETARLVCRDISDYERKLDLTHSYLRAMSPIHLKYLGNMGVRSSMSVSIVIDNDLWGLIACHGYGDEGIRVTLPIRELCRNIGECASTNIQRQLMLQRIKARKPPTMAPKVQHPSGFIAASSMDLLSVFGADFGLLSIQNEARAIGRLDPYREALAILAHLQARRFTTVIDSQNIIKDFPELKYAPGIKILAGLLVIPLSMGGNDFLVFFRRGQLNEVRWAGNPYEKIIRAGIAPERQFLEPRSSFARWTETIVGTSRDWSEDQLDTASVLSLLYGRFIEIWRQKESASQNNRMTRLLIRNSAHEVRTPLNAIVNYLEMALENKIDDTTRDILSKAHKASRSLIYVIDDLLNLTKAEDGQVHASTSETFDLGATVSEVITAFRKEAIRKGLDLTVSTHQGLPEMVKGDASRLRQVLSNVTSNAFQHSVAGGIKVDIRPIKINESSSVIAITVQDLGIGMSEAQLDDLFQEFEQILDEDSSSSRVGTPISDDSQQQPLGIGLAVVARYVRNMNGQIRVRSELGKGTIFGIELPFDHAASTPGVGRDNPIVLAQSPSLPSMPRSLSSTSLPTMTSLQPDNETLKELSKEFEAPPTVDEIVASHENHQNPLTTPEERHVRTLSNRSSPMEDKEATFPFPHMDQKADVWGVPMNVLIAEDNPINARLLTRRLQKLGHQVELSVDGQECHDQFATKPHGVDVILMDIQMPLVDGSQSTSMIRKHEQSLEDLRSARPRVPIIAVSASLTEASRFDYIQSGFDGWILKPINFGRLDYLLKGIKQPELRRNALYKPGQWEIGGWFFC